MKWEKVQRILRKKNHTCTEKKPMKNMQILFYFFIYAASKKKPTKNNEIIKNNNNKQRENEVINPKQKNS